MYSLMPDICRVSNGIDSILTKIESTCSKNPRIHMSSMFLLSCKSLLNGTQSLTQNIAALYTHQPDD